MQEEVKVNMLNLICLTRTICPKKRRKFHQNSSSEWPMAIIMDQKCDFFCMFIVKQYFSVCYPAVIGGFSSSAPIVHKM